MSLETALFMRGEINDVFLIRIDESIFNITDRDIKCVVAARFCGFLDEFNYGFFRLNLNFIAHNDNYHDDHYNNFFIFIYFIITFIITFIRINWEE